MGGSTADTVVCVTGGSGYLGSWLVRKLLDRGCVVHATLRSLADEKKTGLLRALPGAEERLRLFEADMYDADTFEPAIAGCHFVFLVATPLAHDPTSTKVCTVPSRRRRTHARRAPTSSTPTLRLAALGLLSRCRALSLWLCRPQKTMLAWTVTQPGVSGSQPSDSKPLPKYKNTTEATVDAMRIILQQCERSGTVKRVIHTASVTAASPLKEDGSGYKDFANESNWTPLNLSYEFSNAHLNDYVQSKSLSEKELLSYNDDKSSKDQPRALEVVTLACALVGGDTIQTYLWSSIPVIVAPLTGQAIFHNALLFMQALLGSVPLAHVDDVCEAHVFCMEQASMAGRFLCAAGYPNMRDIVEHFAAKHPDLKIQLTEVTGEGVRIVPNTSKLQDLGFKFKYGVEETLDASVECAKRLGEL